MKARMVLVLLLGTSLAFLFVLAAAAQSSALQVILPANAPAYIPIPGHITWERGLSASTQLDAAILGPGLFYLPIVQRQTTPCGLAPTLLAPENGSTVNTLIPTFTYFQNNLPISSTIVTIADNPDFTSPIVYSISSYGRGEKTLDLFNNLTPGTQYYWHAQDRCGSIFSPDSGVFSFITSADGVILPAPSLISPADGMVDVGPVITFTWGSVPGSAGYELWIHAENEGSSLFFLTETSKVVSWLDPNKAYDWHVVAYNSYAFGDSSELWHFTTGTFSALRGEDAGWITNGKDELVNRK